MSILKQASIVALGTALTALGTGGAAKAIVISSSSPDNHLVSPGEFSGVAQLAALDTGAGFCTSSLLSGGSYLLTAAHCITDETGKFDTTLFNNTGAIFNLSSGSVSVPIVDFFIHPDYNGSVGRGNDVALVKLGELAPADAQQYDLYRNTDEVNQIFTVLGYGFTGTGNQGVTEDSVYGIKLMGQNQFDALGDIFQPFVQLVQPSEQNFTIIPGSQLVFDFDNGQPENDFLGVHFGINDTGLGIQEVNIAPGDSGGPSFIGNLIAGITSWHLSDAVVLPDGTVVPLAPDGKIADINPGSNPFRPTNPNSSFGEWANVARVSSYTSFIDDVVAGKVRSSVSVPEPSSVLGIIGLGIWSAFSFGKTRKRQH
ncbi:MAG TPA: trypsin-like serine protease [Leptolyngbyaceae cyanobacterium]